MAIQKTKGKYPVKAMVLSILIFFIISLGIIGYKVMGDVTSVDISTNTFITINSGWGINKTAQKLEEEGIIKYPKVFELVAMSMGLDNAVQPGKIEIKPDMSYKEIILELTKADRDTIKVIIPEGYEIRQIADVLEAANLINREEFFAELDPAKYDYKFLEGIPVRDNALEGYLFPATYNFSSTMTEHEIIDEMLSVFDKNFKPEYYDRAKELGMTVDEVIIMASIVERESNSSEDRNKIAGVFYNRIEQDMRLQSCATVQYILQERKEVLSTKDTQIDSPYNTYKNKGLPIGPIASPGAACIEAALYPEETEALYFVLGSDGKHIFSKTHEEHVEAKNKSQAQ